MLEKDHYIDLVNGEFSGTNVDDLASLFQSIAQSHTPDHIVIHFHGGLVNRDAAHSTATDHLLKCIKDGDGYPLFVIWNSDLKTTLIKSFAQIVRDPLFHRLIKRILQLVLSKYLDSTGGRGGSMELASLIDIPDDAKAMENYATQQAGGSKPMPIADADEKVVLEELETDDVLLKAERSAAAAGESMDASRGIGGGLKTLLDAAIVKETQKEHGITGRESADEARGFVSTAIVLARYGFTIFRAVVSRLIDNRDHGIYTTIVEEVLRTLFVDSIGSVVWSTIKQDTKDSFVTANSGGSMLISHIKDWWAPGKRVTLIGHSTGAVYIGHFLNAWNDALPDDAQVDVIFLAPACTFKFLHERKDVLMKRTRKLIVFGLSDEVETDYWEVPGYKGSLLYIVSGLLEPETVDMPIVGMQRYYKGEPYTDTEITEVIEEVIDDVIWSVTEGAPDGRQCGAREHGDFEDDKTKKSMTHIIREEI